MSFAYTWSSQPELNAPELNSPRPCSHGVGCSYEGPCAFVHPGEEGTGRRLFPARTNEDGSVDKPIVRLIGSPGFYERRRLRLSWADWCAKKGIPYTKKAAAPNPAQKPKAPEVFTPGPVKFTPSSAPIGRPTQAPGSIQAPPRQAPMAPMAPMGSSFIPPMMPMGFPPQLPLMSPQMYAMMRDFCQAQLNQMAHMQPVSPMANPHYFTFQQQQMAQQQQQLAKQQQRNAAKTARDALGERLFPLVVAELESFKKTVNPADWPEKITAGRITGMFLELEGGEVEKMISDRDYLSSQMFEAYDVLNEGGVSAAIAEAEAAPAVAAAPKKLTKSFKDVI